MGKAIPSNESRAHEIMTELNDVDYMLVIFSGVLGYSGDDINTFLYHLQKRINIVNRVVHDQAEGHQYVVNVELGHGFLNYIFCFYHFFVASIFLLF